MLSAASSASSLPLFLSFSDGISPVAPINESMLLPTECCNSIRVDSLRWYGRDSQGDREKDIGIPRQCGRGCGDISIFKTDFRALHLFSALFQTNGMTLLGSSKLSRLSKRLD
ncbi:hypothetical protein PG993_000141 [Apiospora rasikravindrae]|uniref:Secreted protein n=1 Tax=Apiospora rasikravindrae TaxID=990691 RepID=A0ABR1U7P8_9PEZI